MPTTVSLARNAMATRFEVVLNGDNPVTLRAAGEEALEEIERLEAQLSLFRPASEIAHLNARAAREPVRVTPGLFALLRQAKQLHEETGGAFDPTIAPLVQCWGFMADSGHIPPPEELAKARARVGMSLIHLDPHDFTVRFAREGVMLDLGAIGKGFAVERAAELLIEAGITSALLHGGTSTVYALGHPPDAAFWKVAIEDPRARTGTQLVLDSTPQAPPPLAMVPLKDEAMSVSAIWGKFFQAEGKTFGHILDPRTGWPATNAVLAAVVLPSATETDALSTALLTLGPGGHQHLSQLRPALKTLLAYESAGQLRVEAHNLVVEPSR